MQIENIRKEFEQHVTERGCFIVDMTIKGDNEITLIIESEKGVVKMDDCVALTTLFNSLYDRNREDYSLIVTSAGLDKPFKLLKQYKKAVGSKVEVLVKGGLKLIGTLEGVDAKGISVSYERKEKVEGEKKKQMVLHKDFFEHEKVNSVRYFVEI